MTKTANKTKFQHWLKKVGIWGFLFFLVKGIVWLLIGYFVVR